MAVAVSVKLRWAGVVLAGVVALGGTSMPAVHAAKQRSGTPNGAAHAATGASGATGTTGSAGATQGAGGAVIPASAADLASTATDGAKPGGSTVDNAAASLKSADASAALGAQIALLPAMTETDIDVAARSKDVLTHLNAVLRFYRGAIVPVQKLGEPSDVLYAEESQSEATQIAVLAFQSARNEAGILSKLPGAGKFNASPMGETSTGSQAQQSETQRLNQVRADAQNRLAALQGQDADLQAKIAGARGDARAALLQQDGQVQGGIELQKAMVQAVNRINSSAQGTQTGLAGDIDRLEHSAPELLSKPLKTPAPPVLRSLSSARESGVSTQAGALFQLLGTRHAIDQGIKAVDALSKQVDDLRTPFVKVLRATIAQGNALTQGTVNATGSPGTDAQSLAATRKQFDQLTTTFEVLANATLPLSQEGVLLDNARGTLTTWRATVDEEYKDILRHLLLRVAFIAIALSFLAFVNRLLSQAAVRYVNDLRRRRQLLLIRRILIGFLTGLVLIFGFVTQFSSLATFAGFISAGIAVGLQTILLSVAAYFFIVGRYGVKVGDRITVAGVTGDVIEVGLVRFYMMELVGSGTELHSTGRVAVFANSVLFQTGTPIYKQMPGTEYAWHELTAKLNSGADVQAASAAVLAAVTEVYRSYSERIQAQHQQVETWMGTALPAPKVESRLQLVDGGLQFAVLFPVEIDHAAETDQRIAEALVKGMNAEGPLKAGVTELPVIKAAVKS